MLLDAGWEGRRELTMLCGGEPLPQSLADQLLTRGKALWNMYGPTETTVWSTAFNGRTRRCAKGEILLGWGEGRGQGLITPIPSLQIPLMLPIVL